MQNQFPQAGCRRTAAVDAVEIGEDLLVLTETELTRLSGIGPIIWQSARRPVSMETLVGGSKPCMDCPRAMKRCWMRPWTASLAGDSPARLDMHTNAVTVP